MEPTGVYDVIVVGGRIVGASTAALLAQRGFDVLLLEKAIFPSPTVSCPVVFGNSLEILSRFGGEAVLDRLDAPKLRLYGIDYGYANIVGHLPPYKGRDYAYSLQRDRLDEALARHVATLPGVTFREGFAVRELVRQGDRVVGVRGSQNGGAPEEIQSRYAVVGADGRNSLIARLVGAREYDLKPAHAWGYYAYYHNVTPLEEPSAIGYREPGMSGLVFDADQGLTVLSVAATTPSFAEVRKDPEAALLAVIRRMPALAARIERAERATPVMGLAPVGMFRRQPYGDGWALVGDAGSRLDPVTGQGIYQGLHAAELLVDALAQVRDGAAWQPAMRQFHRKRDRDTKAAYDYAALQAMLKPHTWFERRLITRMAEDPAIVQFFLGTANGATDPAENFNLLRALKIAFGPRSRRSVVQAAS
jgi:flavin-dependent dehydrogenase